MSGNSRSSGGTLGKGAAGPVVPGHNASAYPYGALPGKPAGTQAKKGCPALRTAGNEEPEPCLRSFERATMAAIIVGR